MSIRKSISNIVTVILVLCALFITSLIIHQSFFEKENISELENESNVRVIDNWTDLPVDNLIEEFSDSDITIFKFYDYQCPFCKRSEGSIDSLMSKYEDNVNLIYTHYPLTTHEYAFDAAIASECARKQNSFDKYHHLLFENQENLESLSFTDLALEAGIRDELEFENCLSTLETSDVVNSGINLAEELEINLIPSYLINGTLVSGILTFEELEFYIVNQQ